MSKACLSLRHMSNYLEPSFWSELCLARHYVKLSNPEFTVAWCLRLVCCVGCERKVLFKNVISLLYWSLRNVAIVTVYSQNLMLLVVGETLWTTEKYIYWKRLWYCYWTYSIQVIIIITKKGKPCFYLLQFCFVYFLQQEKIHQAQINYICLATHDV